MIALTKVDPPNASDYFHLFDEFKVFRNYFHWAFEFLTPEIWVDSLERPSTGVMHTPPAYSFSGDPANVDAPAFFEQIPVRSWLLPANSNWEQQILDHFGERLLARPRTYFNSASLSLNHLQSLKQPLPDPLKLVQIGPEQVAKQEGILYHNVLKEYFTGVEFLERGLGYCIMDGETMVAYTAANFPMHDDILEVDVRTADDPQYRQHGLATAVSIALLEHCLNNGIDPVWDAANEVSAHMAEKLGYTPDIHWAMYRLME